MTPQEALAQAVADVPCNGQHHDARHAEALLSQLDAAGWTVAREQDAADGEALRRLREALPDGAKVETSDWLPRGVRTWTVMTEWSYLPEGRVRRVWVRHHGFGPSIAAAADACREAIETEL